jgi:hypothetical protein
MPNFSISIISGSGGPATFSPDPLSVPPTTDANAAVTWNNTTAQDHQIKLSDGRVTPLIIAEDSSPEYAIANSITYQCTVTGHEGEIGSINVVAIQDIPPC